MDSRFLGWTVQAWEQQGYRAGTPKAGATQVHDLFHEDVQGFQESSQPWWRMKLFVWEPVLFGTWDGVFTTCMINIFGVVLFLRTGYLVGNTGVPLGMLLVSMVVLVALVTVMSGVGVCEHCEFGSGGIYSMISTVLGGRVGGTVGLLYVFGQCVAGAMYITGFSESVAELLELQSQWAVRGMSATVLLALVGINLAGVKWIIRLQLVLLAVLAVSTLDFVIGTFTHLDPDHGFIGYSAGLLSSNIMPNYSPGENFFTVFGVFFPAATGVMAGFNMSSDLQRPEHSIPVGTLAAIFTSWFLYLVFVFLLGAICTREALRHDFLIAEKVSLVGFLFLLGLYISSLASCMGGLYGAPRILQCIAQERVIPALAFLGSGKGPNNTPVAAICLTSFVTMAFIFIGGVNVLAPIVTINFMLTYSFIDYSYFSMAMTFQSQTEEKQNIATVGRSPQRSSTRLAYQPLIEATLSNYGSRADNMHTNGTLLAFTKDMDRIFPSVLKGDARPEQTVSMLALSHRSKSRKIKATAKQQLMDSFALDLNSKVFSEEQGKDIHSAKPNEVGCGSGKEEQEVKIHPNSCPVKQQPSPGPQSQNTDAGSKSEHHSLDFKPNPESFYSKFCNHWVALIGAFTSILIMFVIQWVYAFANILIALLLFFYIGNTSPGLPIGVAARFNFFSWLKSTLNNIFRRKGSPRDEIIVTPSMTKVGLTTKQLTEENADFASRHSYHQSSFIKANVTVQRQLK